MRRVLALSVVPLITACHGAARDASRAGAPVPMQCGDFQILVPSGGVSAYDNEGDLVVQWKGSSARLQLGHPSKRTPPIAYDASTGGGSPAPELPPTPKDPSISRRAIEKLIEKKLRESRCAFEKDVRADVTWYSCAKSSEDKHGRVIFAASAGDFCGASCTAVGAGDAAICDAIAPVK